MARAELTTLHLARIGQCYSGPLTELGPNVTEVPEDVSTTVDRQLKSAQILTTSGELSPAAHALLDPLFKYTHAYSAVTLLHNQREPVTFELDDQWVEYVGQSLRSVATPRVYTLVAAAGPIVTTAVRAGDHIDIMQESTTEPLDMVAARQLLAVADPEGTWAPATIGAVSFPAELLERAPLRRPLPTTASREALIDHKETVYRFVSALRDAQMSNRTIMAIERMLGFDHLAATHVAYVSGRARLLSEGSASIDYFHDAGMAVGGMQIAADGRLWKTLAPATTAEVATALQNLIALPARPMFDALSAY